MERHSSCLSTYENQLIKIISADAGRENVLFVTLPRSPLTYMVEVTMGDEEGLTEHHSLWASSTVKRELQSREDDGRLLPGDGDSLHLVASNGEF